MDYTQLEKLAVNPKFLRVVKVAITRAASQIANESNAAMSVEMYNKRHSLAMSVLANPEGQTKLFGLHCASLGTLGIEVVGDELSYTGTETVDNDIQFTVNSIWNARAGVTFIELQ